MKFTLAPQLRAERAETARPLGRIDFEGKMRSFLETVLSDYDIHGVDELGLSKIVDLLKVKYGGKNGAESTEKPIRQRVFNKVLQQLHLVC